MQDQLLERLAALRHDEQPMSLATGNESLLDRVPAGDEFFILPEQVACRRVRRRPLPVGRLRTAWAIGPSVDEAARATSVVRPWRGPWRGRRTGEAGLGGLLGLVARRGVEWLAGRGLFGTARRRHEASVGQVGAGWSLPRAVGLIVTKSEAATAWPGPFAEAARTAGVLAGVFA
ncbi:MAG TPA: hypothetical protein VF349_09180 [Candidatus Limnocylindrales bacterium]